MSFYVCHWDCMNCFVYFMHFVLCTLSIVHLCAIDTRECNLLACLTCYAETAVMDFGLYGATPTWVRTFNNVSSQFTSLAWLDLQSAASWLANVAVEEDHHRVLVAAMSNPPTGWRRPRGRPRETWLRTVSKDVQPFNIGIHSAWHQAADRQQWHDLIDTAMLQ